MIFFSNFARDYNKINNKVSPHKFHELTQISLKIFMG